MKKLSLFELLTPNSFVINFIKGLLIWNREILFSDIAKFWDANITVISNSINFLFLWDAFINKSTNVKREIRCNADGVNKCWVWVLIKKLFVLWERYFLFPSVNAWTSATLSRPYFILSFGRDFLFREYNERRRVIKMTKFLIISFFSSSI